MSVNRGLLRIILRMQSIGFYLIKIHESGRWAHINIKSIYVVIVVVFYILFDRKIKDIHLFIIAKSGFNYVKIIYKCFLLVSND